MGIGKLIKGTARLSGESPSKLQLKGEFLSPSIQQEWYETNDYVRADGDELFFFAREREWVYREGEKVSLVEMENEIRTQGGVKDCRVSLIDGQPVAEIVGTLTHWPNIEVKNVSKLSDALGGKRRRWVVDKT